MTAPDVTMPELAPEKPPQGAWVWARENTLSTVWNSILTVIFTAVILAFVKYLAIDWVLGDGRRWESVWTNMRLYIVQAYPADQMARVWTAVAIVIVLSALSIAAWNVSGRIGVKSITRVVQATAVFVAFAALAIGDPGTSLVLAAIAAVATLAAWASREQLFGRMQTSLVKGLRYFFTGLAAVLAAVTVFLVIRFIVDLADAGGTGTRVTVAVVGLAVAAGTFLFQRSLGDRIKNMSVHTIHVLGAILALVVLALWTVPFGRYLFIDRAVVFESGTLSSTTKGPWTVVIFVGVVAYLLGKGLAGRIGESAVFRRVLSLAWVLALPVIVLIVLRDPDWNLAEEGGGFDFLSRGDISLFLGFAVFGALVFALVSIERFSESRGLVGSLMVLGALGVALIPMIKELFVDEGIDFAFAFEQIGDLVLVFFSIVAIIFTFGVIFGKEFGEPGRATGALLVMGALMTWATPFPTVIRMIALFAALFAVGAPAFAGDRRARIRYTALWVGFLAVFVYLIAAINTESTLIITGKSFLGGLTLTFVLALTSISLSFPIGVLMALGRTSTMPIFRVMSTVYIELVRGIPFITVLIFFDLILVLFLPGEGFDSVTLAILAGTLFSGAYLAENVRGGLQSISTGQYEASKAIGLSTLQSTVFIVLPQALRAVIPALVGQTIAIFKDTSLVAIIGLFDFLFIADKVIPAQTLFLGAKLENILFIAVVYWIFTFSFSRASLRLEKKVGLGER